MVRRAFTNNHFEQLIDEWRRDIRRAGDHAGELELSPLYRRNLAKAALGFPTTDRAKFAQAVASMALIDESLNISTIRSSFDREGDVEWIEPLIRLLHLRFYGGPPTLKRGVDPIYDVEFNKPEWFRGPNAPFVFTRRLLGLPRMEHWRNADHGERGAFEYQSNARILVHDGVRSFLKARPGSVRPCTVVHTAVFQRGLSAFAGKLIDDDLELPAFEALPRCLLRASLRAPPHQAVDLPGMLQQIIAFYRGYTVQETPAVPDVDVRRDIDLVRSFMARFPAIFIVDGVQDVGPDLPDLRAAIIDDPVRLLMGHLLYPDIGSAREPASLETYQRNRFVILANGPCSWLGPMTQRVWNLPPAASASAKKYILSDGAYVHPPSLRAYFEASGDDRAGEEPYLQCADAILALHRRDAKLPPLEELAEFLVASVVELRPVWFIPLVLLVLTPGGMRPQTLLRVVAEWNKKPGLHRSPWLEASRSLDERSLIEFLSRFQAMIVAAEDNTLADTAPSVATRGVSGSALSTLSFLSPRTAELLSAPLLARIDGDDLIAIHVLIAQESMRQHTKLMRLADRDDHSSIRSNRRLLQGLYHGLAALDFSGGAQADQITEALPISRRERFSRMYAMFYRLLLEAPPNWEMSRVMSAEATKRDLLLAFIATDQPTTARSASTGVAPSLEPPEWLLRAVHEDAGTAAIANDLYLALCQALLQLNDFERLEYAFACAEMVRAATNPRFLDTRDAEALVKLEVDAEILADHLSSALAQVRRALKHRGVGSEMLVRARELMRQDDPADPFPLRRLVRPLDRGDAAAAISLVQRWAEILGTDAENIEPGASAAAGIRHRRRLFDAYVLFTLVDALRWETYIRDPFSRAFVPSGHAARVQVRVLVLHSRQAADAEGARRLRELARHRVDTLTRTFARYPAERPSMMILESILIRVEDQSTSGFLAALDALILADRQMLWAADRPRLRMRLLFERSKVLARLGKSNLDDSPAFAAWARHDTERLKILSELSGSALWKRLASRVRAPAEPLPPISLKRPGVARGRIRNSPGNRS